jgi:hypothetical protein
LELLQDQVRRQLCGDIEGEEDCQAIGILIIGDTNVLLESENFCIADIRPVEERTEKKNSEYRQDSMGRSL